MSRTHIARDFYDKHVFERKTFGDLAKLEGRPRIYVNSTDLVQGNRFTFDQNTFDIICSDLDPFPISAATAASSAVPGLLSPLVLKNFAGRCGFETPAWATELLSNRRSHPRGAHVAQQFHSYLDSEKKRYIHLVDGGVADNLGMTVVLERLSALGGIELYSEKFGFDMPRHIAVIIVDAATAPSSKLNLQAVSPGLTATMGLVSGVQIRRANFETLDLTQRTVSAIGEKLSSPGHPVTAHFVEVSFDLSDSEEERDYLKHLPTSFKLSDEQVDRLIAAGRKLLRESPDFQAALAAMR
jgi:NTE family protein